MKRDKTTAFMAAQFFHFPSATSWLPPKRLQAFEPDFDDQIKFEDERLHTCCVCSNKFIPEMFDSEEFPRPVPIACTDCGAVQP